MTSLRIPDPTQRRDLAVFAERALRLDAAAVIRLRTRADGLVGAWVATGFDLLAARVVAGSLEVPDFTCAADQLLGGLTGGAAEVDAGFPIDSAWRAALPPETGFVHVDDVPTEVFTELARQGADLAREHGGPQGPPASLLDSEVLDVHAPGLEVKVPLRCVLALAAMGFMTDGAGPAGDGPTGDGDVVRVRALPAWLRIDARFGSVFRRRGDPLNLLVG